MNEKKLSGIDDNEYHTAYISIGSNIGKSDKNCKWAIAALNAAKGIDIKQTSRFYKTEPVDYTDQAWFINAVAKIYTSLEPEQLFKLLKSIEKKAGRDENGIRFGPRILDLDILFFNDKTLQTPELVIPHPRMHKRRFVLIPICDINPDFIHPVLQKKMKDLLESLTDTGQEVIEYI